MSSSEPPPLSSLSCNFRENIFTEVQTYYTIVLCGIVAVLGIIGNSVVIGVFQNARDKQFRQLIFALALTDLFSCSIVLPVDLYHIYRAFQLTKSNVSQSSTDHAFQDFFLGLRNTTFAIEGTVLLCVTLDRYSCICRPQNKRLVTRRFFCVAFMVALVSMCTLEASVTVVHLYFDSEKCLLVKHLRQCVTYAYIFLAVLGMFIFVSLYLRIFFAARGLEQRRRARHADRSFHKSFRSMEALNALAISTAPTDNLLAPTTRGRIARCHSEGVTSFMDCPASRPNSTASQIEPNNWEEQNRTTAGNTSYCTPDASPRHGNCLTTTSSHRASLHHQHSHQRFHRTAAMLFGTTVVFHATLVPSILSQVMAQDVAGPLQRVYYINNAANVILYSLLNAAFRRDVSAILRKYCH